MAFKRHNPLLRRAFILAAVALLGVLAPLSLVSAQDAPLTFWGWPAQITRSFDAEGVDRLSERVLEDTGVEVEVNLVDQPDLGARLRTALPAGTGPDLLATDFDVMGPYWQFMTDLTPYIEAEWGEDWRAMFGAAALSEMDLVSEIAGREGEVLYLPGNMQILGWPYYWIEDYEAAGVDPTSWETFDDFVAGLQTLKDAGYTPMIGSNHPADMVDSFMLFSEVAAPGKMAQAQRGEIPFTDPELAETFNIISMMYNEYMQPGAISTDNATAFSIFHSHQAATAFTFAGTPWFGFLASDNAEVREAIRNAWGTYQIPGAQGLTATGAGIGIVNTSSNKDAAWEVVKWISVGQGAAYGAQYTSAPYGSVAISPAETGTGFDTNLAGPLFEALQTGDNKFRRVLCPAVYSALATVIPGVVTGQIDAKTAAADVQDAFDSSCQNWVN